MGCRPAYPSTAQDIAGVAGINKLLPAHRALRRDDRFDPLALFIHHQRLKPVMDTTIVDHVIRIIRDPAVRDVLCSPRLKPFHGAIIVVMNPHDFHDEGTGVAPGIFAPGRWIYPVRIDIHVRDAPGHHAPRAVAWTQQTNRMSPALGHAHRRECRQPFAVNHDVKTQGMARQKSAAVQPVFMVKFGSETRYLAVRLTPDLCRFEPCNGDLAFDKSVDKIAIDRNAVHLAAFAQHELATIALARGLRYLPVRPFMGQCGHVPQPRNGRCCALGQQRGGREIFRSGVRRCAQPHGCFCLCRGQVYRRASVRPSRTALYGALAHVGQLGIGGCSVCQFRAIDRAISDVAVRDRTFSSQIAKGGRLNSGVSFLALRESCFARKRSRH